MHLAHHLIFAQSIRSSRPLASVLRALTSLNAKFSGSKIFNFAYDGTASYSSKIILQTELYFACSYIWLYRCSDVSSLAHTSFPDEYFTCSARCQVNLLTSCRYHNYYHRIIIMIFLCHPLQCQCPDRLASQDVANKCAIQGNTLYHQGSFSPCWLIIDLCAQN